MFLAGTEHKFKYLGDGSDSIRLPILSYYIVYYKLLPACRFVPKIFELDLTYLRSMRVGFLTFLSFTSLVSLSRSSNSILIFEPSFFTFKWADVAVIGSEFGESTFSMDRNSWAPF